METEFGMVEQMTVKNSEEHWVLHFILFNCNIEIFFLEFVDKILLIY